MRRKLAFGCYAGLDLSLAGTAGVLLDAQGKVVSVLAFSTSKQEVKRAKAPYVLHLSPEVKQGDAKAMWARTVAVADAVEAWMGEWGEPGCLVAIEDHAFGARGTSIYQLGHLHGLVRRDLQYMSKKWLLVAPTELKAAVTGKGNADKAAMMSIPTPGLDQKILGSSTRNNVVDAYWLARLMLAWSEVGSAFGAAEKSLIPDTFLKVMHPHSKRPGLLARKLLP